ncbi:E1A [Canine adenovirus 2]|uniref:E1A n=1 Tax=Canine adenovirus serotype 2 TaxID=10514 RepID=UPI00001D969A|nr:E1A [Canine adenovirus 2]
MKYTIVPAPRNLHDYVLELLEEWQPDCLDCEYSHGSPSPPTLHDLFDVELETSHSPFVGLCDSCAEADTDSSASTEADSGFSPLSTPPVSPIPPHPTSPASISDDMLLCLEEMPTFDDEDEVRSAATTFERWENTFDPHVGPIFGCLRCAFYQEQDDNALCGLCYLKALAEVPFAMPVRSEPASAGAEEEDDEVIFVSAKPGGRKRSAATPCEPDGVSKRPCVPEPEQTEPLDLSLKPRPN